MRKNLRDAFELFEAAASANKTVSLLTWSYVLELLDVTANARPEAVALLLRALRSELTQPSDE
jgi:hypothetical protein